MARPREFDRDSVLQLARQVFWARGYAATSTDELLKAMGIGRQSLYNAFGGKWQLYLEVLADYQQGSISDHLRRLQQPVSALEGIRALLEGLAVDDDTLRGLGCMGLGSTSEFGAGEPELQALRDKGSAALLARLTLRIKEGQASGEIDTQPDPALMARYVLMSMTGIQLAARGGAKQDELCELARFATDRLQLR